MSTIRRLYFYALSLISALMVIWGLINLLQTLLRGSTSDDYGSQIATGLSLLLVGLPIFLLHWRAAQRDAARESEERASRIRSVFLYTAQAIPLVTALVFQGTYLVSHYLNRWLGVNQSYGWFEFSEDPRDAVIIVLVNLAAWAYFAAVTRSDWQGAWDHKDLKEARRLYRYLWLLGSLFLSVAAVFYLVRYPIERSTEYFDHRYLLVAALTLVVIGFPILGYTWRLIQSALGDPTERHSLLRLVVLYAVSLAGVVGVLSSAGSILTLAIRWVMGETYTFPEFLHENSSQLGYLVPLGMMWWYFGGVLNREVAALPDQPRRAALRRLYYDLLALLGLAVTYSGLLSLSNVLARELSSSLSYPGDLRYSLSGALSAVLVGLPLWLVSWQRIQAEAARRDELGDHARRSLLRKGYLYLVLFVTVVASMAFSGRLLYLLFNQLLGSGSSNFTADVIEAVLSLLITLGLLVYHLQVLRRDGQVAQLALGNLHRAFPVVILAEQDNDAFASATVAAVQRAAPETPVRVALAGDAPPAQETPCAVVLPAGLAMRLPAAWQTWLDAFGGRRLLAPLPQPGWTWLGLAEKEAGELANETARAIRQMAEGEAVRLGQTFGPWAIFGYLLGGLGALVMLALLFSVMSSALYR